MKTSRPLIGIIPDYKEVNVEGRTTRKYYNLCENYVKAVNKAGGAAVILTYDYDLIDSYLESLDGLMVVGGYFDIHPKYYGENEAHESMKFNAVREEFEHVLGKKAIATDLPFLGICNGMQLLNTLHGGKVTQHIPDHEDFMDHEQSHVEGFTNYDKGYHRVEIERNSKLFEICGSETIITNSSHHQAAKNIGGTLKVSGRASDGVIEALEDPNHPFCLGVQWHPEFEVSESDAKIFQAFVKAAKEYKSS
jgi:putative glutamine amidotransferase